MREGWRKAQLKDVCRLINGRAYKKAELLQSGPYPVLRVGNFFTNQSWYYSDLELGKDKYCDNGDLLYAWSASFGPRIWEGSKVIYHYHIWKVDFDSVQVEKNFLYYWFDWDKERIKKEQGAGTTMIHVTKGSMEERKLFLPPLPEQKRIVTILDEAFAGIDTAIANTEKNLANARELFESYLNSVFTKNDSAWGKVRLETVCKKITVGHVGSMASRYKPEGVPLLRSQNIRPFYVDMNRVVFIDEGFHKELKKSALHPGDLGIVRTGYPGTAAVIPDSLPVANCSDLVIVRPGEIVLSDFLAIVFNSYYGKKEVAGVLVGAAQKHFNITAAKAALIPLPSVDEQRRVVAECSDVREEHQRLEAIYQQKLTALAELKQSLLQKAFSGGLTADAADAVDTVEEALA